MNIFLKILLMATLPLIMVSGLYSYHSLELSRQLDATIDKRLNHINSITAKFSLGGSIFPIPRCKKARIE